MHHHTNLMRHVVQLIVVPNNRNVARCGIDPSGNGVVYFLHSGMECRCNDNYRRHFPLSGTFLPTITDSNNKTFASSSMIPADLNVQMKWFGLNNAAGVSGPLVLVFAVPSMLEGNFCSAEVVGIACMSYVGDCNHIFLERRGPCCISLIKLWSTNYR